MIYQAGNECMVVNQNSSYYFYLFLSMKLYFIILFIVASNITFTQDLIFNQPNGSTISGDTYNKVYGCEGVLINNTDSTLSVKFTRLQIDRPSSGWLTSICTEVECYLVSMNSVVEDIQSNTTHQVDVRWQIWEDTYTADTAYTSWIIENEETGLVIDTAECHLFFDPVITSTKEVLNNPIVAFPNPVQSYLNFNINNPISVKIYDRFGHFVEFQDVQNSQIDVSTLNSGYYIGILKSKNSEHVFNFIKTGKF